MSAKLESDDDILILGSSPSDSINIEESMVKFELEDAMVDISLEANKAFKAQFQLADSPSKSSMMAASTLIKNDTNMESLQKRLGELMDENIVLKETLKRNNEVMKEQFVLINTCQEDMQRSLRIHDERLDERTGELNKLREENTKLRIELTRHKQNEEAQLNNETGEKKTDNMSSSLMEFVSSPDDDTINKLTAQLELVEKQRREVIVENEKLTWQKESLENISNYIVKERDEAEKKIKELENDASEELKKRDLKEKQLETNIRQLQNELKGAQKKIEDFEQMKSQLLNNEDNFAKEKTKMKICIEDLRKKLQAAQESKETTEELTKKDDVITKLLSKNTFMKNALQSAEVKIKDLENIKEEFVQYKAIVVKMQQQHKEQIQELKKQLVEAQRLSLPVVQQNHFPGSSGRIVPEYQQYTANVKRYNQTLKHLADCLNSLVEGSTDSHVRCLEMVTSSFALTLNRSSEEQARHTLLDFKNRIADNHRALVEKIGIIRGCLQIFEEIFAGFKDLMRKVDQENPQNIEQLTSALVARGEEISSLKAQAEQVAILRGDSEALRAQLDVYKADFEAERASRAKIASEWDAGKAELRNAEKRIQQLCNQLEEVRKRNPSLHKSVTSASPASAASSVTSSRVTTTTTAGKTTTNRTGTEKVRKKKKPSESNGEHEKTPPPLRFVCPVCDQTFKTLIFLQQHIYTCPKCMRFSSTQYQAMEDHFDFCLDDL